MVSLSSMVDGRGPRRDRIAFLGHSTVLIEVGGQALLTDPLLRGPRRPPAPLRAGARDGGRAARRRRAPLACAPGSPRPPLAARPRPRHADVRPARGRVLASAARLLRGDRARRRRAGRARRGLGPGRRRRSRRPPLPVRPALGQRRLSHRRARTRSTSPGTPASSRGWPSSPASSTSRCCRLPDGDARSVPGTWTRSRPRARRGC